MAASGTRLYQRLPSRETAAERLEVVKLLIDLGEDVNAADSLRHHVADGCRQPWRRSRGAVLDREGRGFERP